MVKLTVWTRHFWFTHFLHIYVLWKELKISSSNGSVWLTLMETLWWSSIPSIGHSNNNTVLTVALCYGKWVVVWLCWPPVAKVFLYSTNLILCCMILNSTTNNYTTIICFSYRGFDPAAAADLLRKIPPQLCMQAAYERTQTWPHAQKISWRETSLNYIKRIEKFLYHFILT